jgi:hypothetical protein
MDFRDIGVVNLEVRTRLPHLNLDLRRESRTDRALKASDDGGRDQCLTRYRIRSSVMHRMEPAVIFVLMRSVGIFWKFNFCKSPSTKIAPVNY